MDESPKPKIFKTLFLSIVSALVIIISLISFYGRSYSVPPLSKVLIAPKALKTLSYIDIEPIHRKKHPFTFDAVALKVSVTKPPIEITLDDYAQIYEIIERDRSTSTITAEMARSFEEGFNYITLEIRTKPKETLLVRQPSPMIFQRVDIHKTLPIYRVSERSEAMKTQWIYFRHLGSELIEEVMALSLSLGSEVARSSATSETSVRSY